MPTPYICMLLPCIITVEPVVANNETTEIHELNLEIKKNERKKNFWKEAFLSTERLLVVRPHSDYLNGLDIIEDLIDKTMLNVDSAGKCARQVSDQFFVGQWILIRVLPEQFEQSGRLRLEARCSDFDGVLLSLFGEHQTPAHQPGSSLH